MRAYLWSNHQLLRRRIVGREIPSRSGLAKGDARCHHRRLSLRKVDCLPRKSLQHILQTSQLGFDRAMSLSRRYIELPCYCAEPDLAMQGQISATRKTLAQKSVGVFVEPCCREDRGSQKIDLDQFAACSVGRHYPPEPFENTRLASTSEASSDMMSSALSTRSRSATSRLA
jgi:hypothetical protein